MRTLVVGRLSAHRDRFCLPARPPFSGRITAAIPPPTAVPLIAAMLEAVINDAREAGEEEAAEKAMQLLGGLWQRIVKTPKLLRQLTEPLSEAEWLRRYAPKTEAEQAKAKAVAMDWEAPDHGPGHG